MPSYISHHFTLLHGPFLSYIGLVEFLALGDPDFTIINLYVVCV